MLTSHRSVADRIHLGKGTALSTAAANPTFPFNAEFGYFSAQWRNGPWYIAKRKSYMRTPAALSDLSLDELLTGQVQRHLYLNLSI